MAKKRKTREQKKLADLRHTFQHKFVEQINSAAKIPPQIETLISPSYKPKSQTAASQYPYLIKDLSNTGILTLGILAFQIILFALLTNHILKIPGIGY